MNILVLVHMQGRSWKMKDKLWDPSIANISFVQTLALLMFLVMITVTNDPSYSLQRRLQVSRLMNHDSMSLHNLLLLVVHHKLKITSKHMKYQIQKSRSTANSNELVNSKIIFHYLNVLKSNFMKSVSS